jgi:hypothetical protein
MTKLTDNIFAVEVSDGADGFNVNQYGAGSELNYWLRQKLIVIDLPAGNWQLICTTREVKAMHAPALFGYAMISDHYAQETINSLLTSKGLDGSKNYALLKKG